MSEDLFPETIDKGKPGAQWWIGNRQCRNWQGYFQSREAGRGRWQFQVPWFSNDDVTCTVYAVDRAGQLVHEDGIPIDGQNRITILGRKFSPEFWDH